MRDGAFKAVPSETEPYDAVLLEVVLMEAAFLRHVKGLAAKLLELEAVLLEVAPLKAVVLRLLYWESSH